jgi:lipoic acid synthetase
LKAVGRLPPWLRVQLPSGDAHARFNTTHAAVVGYRLHTVCEQARCPNIHDCWSRGTATFMVAGKECTRGCRFCAVSTRVKPAALDPEEPQQLAAAVKRMDLKHVVITVVNRDDLADGGAAHYRRCVDAVFQRLPHVSLELLSSDLGGNVAALERLLDGIPLAVFAHNVECVPRLDRTVRDRRASFAQSLAVLAHAKRCRPDLFTKSSIMVGLGEQDAELVAAMLALRSAGVDLLTLGQYLSPGRRYLPVQRFVLPEQFELWRQQAQAMGFRAVAAGPLVRSSYRAGLLLEEARGEPDQTVKAKVPYDK